MTLNWVAAIGTPILVALTGVVVFFIADRSDRLDREEARRAESP